MNNHQVFNQNMLSSCQQ